MFPSNIVASIFGLEQKGYFKAAEGAQNAPEHVEWSQLSFRATVGSREIYLLSAHYQISPRASLGRNDRGKAAAALRKDRGERLE